jgi:hypothetical protein
MRRIRTTVNPKSHPTYREVSATIVVRGVIVAVHRCPDMVVPIANARYPRWTPRFTMVRPDPTMMVMMFPITMMTRHIRKRIVTNPHIAVRRNVRPVTSTIRDIGSVVRLPIRGIVHKNPITVRSQFTNPKRRRRDRNRARPTLRGTGKKLCTPPIPNIKIIIIRTIKRHWRRRQ